MADANIPPPPPPLTLRASSSGGQSSGTPATSRMASMRALARSASIANAYVGGVAPVYYCQLCLEQHALPVGLKLPCGHTFCRGCVRSLVDAMVAQGLGYIRCPYDVTADAGSASTAASAGSPAVVPSSGSAAAMPSVPASGVMQAATGTCGAIMPDEVVTALLADDSAALERYRLRKANADNPDTRTCPFCNHFQAGTARHPAMTCERCRREYCFLHSNAHPGRSCEAYEKSIREEQRLTEAALSKMSRPCPQCGVLIMKESGCNAMRCAKCGTNFCWLCGSRIGKGELPTHFQWYNIAGCANKQFASATPSLTSRLCMPLLTLVIAITCGIPAFVIALVCVVSCCCCCVPLLLSVEDGPLAGFMVVTEVITRIFMLLIGLLLAVPVLIALVVLACVFSPCVCIARMFGVSGIPRTPPQAADTAAPAPASNDHVVVMVPTPLNGAVSSPTPAPALAEMPAE